jgi:hypothetical protein
MAYVKTNGIGFDFTDNEAEALLFNSESQAKRWAKRLKKHPSYTWEVVAGAKGYCIVVNAGK